MVEHIPDGSLDQRGRIPGVVAEEILRGWSQFVELFDYLFVLYMALTEMARSNESSRFVIGAMEPDGNA